jgi:2'-5' RNA ligase
MQVEGLRVPPAPRRVRVFRASDLHVTLGFLGSVQEAEALDAWALVDGAPGLRPVDGTFDRVKPLGHPRKPSALSALVDDGADALAEMTLALRAPLLDAAGAPPDERAPLPHMTIARIQRRAQSAERREALRWAEEIDLSGVTFTVASLALYTWAADRQERLFRIVAEQTL